MDDLGPSSLEPPPAKRPRLDRDEYRVRVAGRDFVLNREQVEADAPSLLSMSLLVRRVGLRLTLSLQGEWAEGEERVLDLKHAHDPDLFRLVVNHLRCVRSPSELAHIAAATRSCRSTVKPARRRCRSRRRSPISRSWPAISISRVSKSS